EQAVDRHAPEFAGDVPQRHVDAAEGVGHERPAAHVAVRTVDLLPQVFDACWVLTVEQLRQRADQGDGDGGFQAGDFAPAGDLVVGLDLDERLGADAEAAYGGDFDGGGAVLHLVAGTGGEGVIQGQGGSRGGSADAEQVAAVDLFARVAHRG